MRTLHTHGSVIGWMSHARLGIVTLAIALQLLATGCAGSGGSGSLSEFFSGLFGGSSEGEAFGTSGAGFVGAGPAGLPGSGLQSPESIQNPEPASLALFGMGLAGLGMARRRRRASDRRTTNQGRRCRA